MAQAKRDDNRITTFLGDNSGVTSNLLIDNATGYTKIAIRYGTPAVPASISTNAVRDDNYIPVALATNSGVQVPISIDNVTGYTKVIIS